VSYGTFETMDGTPEEKAVNSGTRPIGPTSYRPMFLTSGDPEWYGNAQRFATREEAEDSALALWQAWTMAREWRVDESGDPVNYRRVDGRNESL
jgi:hypothetical protein